MECQVELAASRATLKRLLVEALEGGGAAAALSL